MLSTISTEGGALKVENNSAIEIDTSFSVWVSYKKNGIRSAESVRFAAESRQALKPGELEDFHHLGLQDDSFNSTIRKIQDEGGTIQGFQLYANIDLPPDATPMLPGRWLLYLNADSSAKLIQKINSAKIRILSKIVGHRSEDPEISLIAPAPSWIEEE